MRDECPPYILATLEELEALDLDPEVEKEPILFRAANRDLREVVEWLIKRGEPVNTPNGSFFNPLFEACVQGNLGMAYLLLEAGADPCFVDEDGLFILDHMMKSDFSEWRDSDQTNSIVALLLKRKACFGKAIQEEILHRSEGIKSWNIFPNDLRKYLQSGREDVDEFILKYFDLPEDPFLIQPEARHTDVFALDQFGKAPIHYLVTSSIILTNPKSVENAIFYVMAMSHLGEVAIQDAYRDSQSSKDEALEDGFFTGEEEWTLSIKDSEGRSAKELSWAFDEHHGIFGSGLESSCNVVERAKRREAKFLEKLIEQEKINAIFREKDRLRRETVGEGKPHNRKCRRGRL